MPRHLSQPRIWAAFAGILIFALWLLSPILLPFVAGLSIAYFLDPVVERMARLRLPRWLGTLIVLLGFIALLALLAVLLVPLLQSQIGALAEALPGYVADLRERLLPLIHQWSMKLSPTDVAKLRDAAGSYAGDAAVWAGGVLKKIISEGFVLFDIVTLLVITPVVAFYLLRDWPKLTANIDSLFPRKHYDEIHHGLADIDKTLSGFIRGQALVCVCLGLIYGIGLTLVGLKYGATIGIIAGLLSFMPYVGSTFGFVTSMLLAFIQFDSGLQIGLVLCVFLLGQGLEGYVLTPKLVGDRVGLHPVWILFALFAGGSLLGFAGVLIAVPFAAVTGVIVRTLLRRYKGSPLYMGDAK